MRSRLALQQTASFAVLLLLLAWAAYAIAIGYVLRDFDDRVSDRSAGVRSLMRIRDNSVSWLNAQADPEIDVVFAQTFYQLMDSSGRVVDASSDTEMSNIHLSAAAWLAMNSHGSTWETVRLASGSHLRIKNTFVAATNPKQFYVLRVGVSTQEVDERRRFFLLFLLAAIPLIVGIHAATAWRMSGTALQPLAQLSAAANEINSADLQRRFPTFTGSLEMGQLTGALNAMIDRIEGPFQRMRDFLPNVSHEIRRPLSNLRAESENALRMATTETELREVLAHQLKHVDLITATMSDLMELARCGSQSTRPARQYQSLSELLTACVDSMMPGANARNVELTSNIAPGIMGEFDTCQMCRVLQNLIDNAIKYNRANGHVHVNAVQENSAALIVISDTGRGIPSLDLPHIFDRSYRSQNAKALDVQGSGLGLYFVKMVVDAHRGLVEVESVEGQGSSFRILLPGTSVASDDDHCSKAASLAG